MPKETNTVEVTPVDGHLGLIFSVESWSQPEQPHIVDISQHGGNGACSCRDFQCRKEPAIKAGAELFSNATTCKHCRAVHHFWLKTVLPTYIASHKQGIRNHDEG